MVSLGLIILGASLAIPAVNGAMKGFRLKSSAREVERELQRARLGAVSSNRAFRVRFNCPATGQFRVVELIGTPSAPDPSDSSGDRCGTTQYPYPAADNDPLTFPNHDGPVRTLMTGVRFTGVQTIEFWPDGTAHADSGGTVPWPLISTSGVSVTVANDSTTATITVNRLGKIQVQ